MCSKTDSEATYCSEVEELLKATTSAIKCSAMEFSTLPLRRSQRISEKSKTKLVDLNDFCLCDFMTTDKVNKKKTKYSSRNNVKTKISQEIFSAEDLKADHRLFCGDLICQQAEEHPFKNSLKLHVNVPLDLSKKSKESIKETFKEGKEVPSKGSMAQNSKATSKANSKLFSTQIINTADGVIKNSKNDENVNSPKLENDIVKSIGLDDTNSLYTLKTDIKPLNVNTNCKRTDEDAKINCKPTKEYLTIRECVKANEIKPSKSNTPVADISSKANAINVLNKEELIFKNYSTFQYDNKNIRTSEYKTLNKSLSNEIIETNVKNGKKRNAESKNNMSAKKSKIAKLQTDSLDDKANAATKRTRKSHSKNSFCKNSGSILRNSKRCKQLQRKQIEKRKISTSKTKGIQKTICSDKTIKFSNENILTKDDKRKNFENIRTLDDSEKSLIEENYRKTLFRINSEEISKKTKDCEKFRRKRRLSLSQNAIISTETQQVKRSIPTAENLKNFASFQNPPTPAQSTQDALPKSVIADVYPPHFKYQLPPEAAFNRYCSVQPTYIITPEDTPSIELLDSSSSSPSLPESLCELLQKNDIKDLLNVDKVVYRLYDYHIGALALVLNLNQDYLRKILDKIVNIQPKVLKNINKAVEEPFVMDQDLFTTISNQSAESVEVVFNSQSPQMSKT